MAASSTAVPSTSAPSTPVPSTPVPSTTGPSNSGPSTTGPSTTGPSTTGPSTDTDVGRPRLLGIGEAAARTGASERALRYYQQLGLITPSGRTPGGLRRYSEEDLARVARLRELQHLLGLNLEEIRVVLANDDRLAALRREYRAEDTGADRRRQLIREGLEVRAELRATVDGKLSALQAFLAELDRERDRLQRLLDDAVAPATAG